MVGDVSGCGIERDAEWVLTRWRRGAGAQTDMCIRSTLHGALVRGYDATLVSDAHTTEDMTQWGAPPPDGVIAHMNLYWSNQRAPGRAGGIVASKDVIWVYRRLMKDERSKVPRPPSGSVILLTTGQRSTH